MFIVFLITLATCPLSTEFNSLTIITKQEHRTSRDKARRMRPMARSGRSESANRCLPEKRKGKLIGPATFLLLIPSPALVFIHASKKMGPKHSQLEQLMQRPKMPPPSLHRSHIWVGQEGVLYGHTYKIHIRHPCRAGGSWVTMCKRGQYNGVRKFCCAEPDGGSALPRGGCVPEKGCSKSRRACTRMEISKQPLQQSNCTSKSPEQWRWHDTEDLNYWYQGAWKETHLQPDITVMLATPAVKL